jgi:aldehyde:ferredoxin oxidoreductase
MSWGYMGKVLWVDLGSGQVVEQVIPDRIYDRFLSGMGLAAWLLYHRIPAGADPRGPDNVLGFVAGLLTGTGSLFTGRWMVVAKSPLTGCWGDANCGGNFAPAIKRCGYDAIFITGISPKPVYLVVDAGKARLLDASNLWGRDALETEQILLKKNDCRKPHVACIGPAGENLSLISGIVNAGGRLAARAGLGAVMGSKRLKAVVCGGAKRIPVKDHRRVKELSRECNDHVKFQPPFVSGTIAAYMGSIMRMLPAQMETDGMLYKIMLKKWGTVSMNQMSIEMGDAPIKNWKGTNEDFSGDKTEKINPDIFTETVVSKYFCYSCPLGCGAISLDKETQQEAHRPEYETVLALGGLCMNENAESIFVLNDMLNRAGMDTISAGGTVAFAMECFENGLITRKDTGGIDLTWGNHEAIVALIEMMIHRRGIGDLLADGVRVAARKIGRGAERYAIHAGGQELAMHDGRLDPGFALHNSVEPAPGRHTVGSQLYYEMFQLWQKIEELPEPWFLYGKGSKYEADAEKTAAAVACSQYINVINGAGCCLFGAFLGTHRLPLFDWLNAATGWEKSPQEYLEMGKQVQTIKQAFNIRHGIRPKDNVASNRSVGIPPQEKGANEGRTVPIQEMMKSYWKAFGWDPDSGEPPPDAIKKLKAGTAG